MVLYVHIPFCVKKCFYCDFLSGQGDGVTKEKYVKSLLNEISFYGRRYGKSGRNIHVTSVFLGGGTPSVLDGSLTAAILERLREQFYIEENAEITVECNPGTLSADKLKTYREAGVNRLSMGLQSADDNELRRIGRIHTYEQFLEGYTLARECGFNNINIDIMSALPGQTMESYKDTLDKVTALKPEHISAYSLILEEGTVLYERISALERDGKTTGLPDEDTEREMYYMTKKILSDNGYERYEISNYARKGYECRHNIAYWERDDYLGLGLGASSCMDNIRTKNVTDIEEYMKIFDKAYLEHINEKGARDEEETDILTKEDMMAEFMFLGLRMTKGISKKRFKECFGRSYDTIYGKVTDKLIKERLLNVSVDGDKICLTEIGIDVSNMVLAEFLLD